MKLEIRWVEDLIALETEKSISRAAESRCVSQSSFTRRIQHLEDMLGFALLNRDSKYVSFTDAGMVLLKTSKSIREQLQNTLNVLYEQQQEKQDSIKICISHSLLAYFFPKFIRTLPENMQQIPYEISTVNLWEGLKKLMQGGCHFFICYGDQDLIRSLNPEILTFIKLEDIQVVPVSLNEGSEPQYHIYRSFPLLAYGRETFLKGFVDEKVKGLNYKKLYEADNAQDLRELVLQGLGVAWLPYAIVEQDILSGKLVQFDEQYSFHNQIYIIKNKISDPENVNMFWEQLLYTL
jgi:LysR family transcriptional regulator, hypochlorite-specific transcription factor HypT